MKSTTESRLSITTLTLSGAEPLLRRVDDDDDDEVSIMPASCSSESEDG